MCAWRAGRDERVGEQALGLEMPVDDKSAIKIDDNVLTYLLQCLKDGTSEDSFTNMFGSKKFAKGKVKDLVDKMRTLRTLKIRRVEFRACTLDKTRACWNGWARCWGRGTAWLRRSTCRTTRCSRPWFRTTPTSTNRST